MLRLVDETYTPEEPSLGTLANEIRLMAQHLGRAQKIAEGLELANPVPIQAAMVAVAYATNKLATAVIREVMEDADPTYRPPGSDRTPDCERP